MQSNAAKTMWPDGSSFWVRASVTCWTGECFVSLLQSLVCLLVPMRRQHDGQHLASSPAETHTCISPCKDKAYIWQKKRPSDSIQFIHSNSERCWRLLWKLQPMLSVKWCTCASLSTHLWVIHWFHACGYLRYVCMIPYRGVKKNMGVVPRNIKHKHQAWT